MSDFERNNAHGGQFHGGEAAPVQPPAQPPMHARDDAESTEQADTRTTIGGNASDAPEREPVRTLFGELAAVELRYDGNEPAVAMQVGDQLRPIENVYRVQLTHQAGPQSLPVLALWTYRVGQDQQPLVLPNVELYDVEQLRRSVTRALLRAASERQFARSLALQTAALAVADVCDTQPTYGTLVRYVEQAHSKVTGQSADPLPSIGDAVTRAWLLAEDAERMVEVATTQMTTGNAVELLRDLAAATKAVTERLAGVTTYGVESRPFTSAQPRASDAAAADAQDDHNQRGADDD